MTRSAQEELAHLLLDSKYQDFDFTQAIEEMNEDIGRANAVLTERLKGEAFEPVPLVPV